jgi:serine/threonine protein kinase
MPFDGNSLKEVFAKIKKGEFHMPRHLSPNCKDIIKRMITVNPKKRINCEEILEHPWIKQTEHEKCNHNHTEFLNSDLIEKL